MARSAPNMVCMAGDWSTGAQLVMAMLPHCLIGLALGLSAGCSPDA
jgi:hypothetical protein